MAHTRRSEKITEKWALPARQARSRATRERILDAAERCFEEHGYENSRMADIARLARCSVGAVYIRFKDKDALFRAIIETFAAELRAKLLPFAAGKSRPSMEVTVRGLIENVSTSYAAHRGLARAVMERGFGDPAVMLSLVALRQELHRLLDDAAGISKKSDPSLHRATRIAGQMIAGFIFLGVINPRAAARIEEKASVNGLTDAVIAYLRSVQKS